MTRQVRYVASKENKYCPKCKTVKKTSEFRKYLSRYDGFSPYCSNCISEYKKDWRSKRTEKE